MRKFLLILFFFAEVFFLSAETIESISVSGLKRTKDSYMQKVLARFAGMESSSLDLHEVETLLQAEGLFSEIAVNVSDDGKALFVEVKEKWSIIPLPFASYTNEGFMGGLILMDNNAFGVRNTLMIGGVYAPSYQTVMLRLQRPAIFQKQLGYSSFLSYNKKKVSIDDLDEENLYKIDSHKLNAEFALEKKLSQNFSVSLGAKYAGFIIPDDPNFDSVHQWVFAPAAKYALADWNGYFLSEKYIEAKGEAGGSSEKELVSQVMLHAFFQQPLVPRLRLTFDGFISLESHKNLLLRQTRQNVSNTLLPTNFHSQSMAAADTSLEGAVLKLSVMTLSLYASYQLIAAEDYDGKTAFCHGPGGGLKVYLQKINFPACSLGVYYNVPRGYVQFGASIGVSF
ncbi:hypothetical protein [Treponema sp.]|uniref:hypothetical protein n=1 Tax=Treponema sp. TaxID=166 RepID=UPI0025E9A092|nr:hypothetical protein [Treponema sp.]MBR4323103.1 hypothetical protein [Treponema sp.]